MNNPLETYLRSLREIRSSGGGVKETSYYGTLETLFNEIGKTLKPRVRCIINLQNRGAGLPDGGFYTSDQFQKASATKPLEGQLPARGAIEVKGTKDDAQKTAGGKQVDRYLQKYGQVLVTNLRDFILAGRDSAGQSVQLETYQLAESEAAFWSADLQQVVATHNERFIEYLKRVMLHNAPLDKPEDVAWFLASYARDARARIEIPAHQNLDALATIREALEEALGVRFEGDKGLRFFRSTFVQTLFYGVFSAWVLWSKQPSQASNRCKNLFDWRLSAHYLRVPILRKLFYEAAEPGQLDQLNLSEVLDWATTVLNRVDRAAFFASFNEGEAVQYFYEPFLENFDPALRKELGVWYTPNEIVRYMVARVDTVLREELNRPDGLADPDVYVLDPCCGTGAYLVEVIKRIAGTLKEKGGDALLGDDLKRAATERVFGFEILPAPFVVAHLQMGLLLNSLGAPLSEKKSERAGIYLTNALTGWEPPQGPKKQLLFPELAEERDAAEEVKRERPILVVLGNPPYNGFAGVALGEERDLTEAYRTTKRAPKPQGQGLNELYVRFFRMAERRIVELSKEGVVCFISNSSWLGGLSHPGMRERYLEEFDRIWIDNLNGDKFRTGKLTPEGEPDPSIFSTEWNREGIQVGTAIALLVRKNQHRITNGLRSRNLWGKNKRVELLTSAEQNDKPFYDELTPPLDLGLPFLPTQTNDDYAKWPILTDLFPVSFPGVKTSRDDVVIDIDREALIKRMEQYFDKNISHDEMKRLVPSVMKRTARFNPEIVRETLCKRKFIPNNIVRYCYRPFDNRWLYWEPETKLLDEKRTEYLPHIFQGNIFLFTTGRTRKNIIEPALTTTLLNDLNCMDSGARGFPLFLFSPNENLFEKNEKGDHKLNLSELAKSYLEKLAVTEQELFYHFVSITHSPVYRNENAGALRQDWPRVPLPASKDVLLASAELGRRIAALLDTESPVSGVTAATPRPELKTIAVISRAGSGSLSADDLELTAGWGHGGKGGITMPGKGRMSRRDYTADEQAAITAGAEALGLTFETALELLGQQTCDVYLNEVAYWRNVPLRVWEYTIGGYQVMKKWLSYRELELLGRSLKSDEAREVMNMARRIAAILLLEPQLDENYRQSKEAAYEWSG